MSVFDQLFQLQKEQQAAAEQTAERERATAVSMTGFRRRQLAARSGFSGLVNVGDAVTATASRLAIRMAELDRTTFDGTQPPPTTPLPRIGEPSPEVPPLPGMREFGDGVDLGHPDLTPGEIPEGLTPPDQTDRQALAVYFAAIQTESEEREANMRIITGEEFELTDRLAVIEKTLTAGSSSAAGDDAAGVSSVEAAIADLESMLTERGGRYAGRSDIQAMLTQARARLEAIRAAIAAAAVPADEPDFGVRD